MTSFTPGPWRVGKKYASDVVHTASAALIARAIIGSDPEREANARLIAAAPELLVALKELLDSEHLTGSELGDVIARANAAIAKATS